VARERPHRHVFALVARCCRTETGVGQFGYVSSPRCYDPSTGHLEANGRRALGFFLCTASVTARQRVSTTGRDARHRRVRERAARSVSAMCSRRPDRWTTAKPCSRRGDSHHAVCWPTAACWWPAAGWAAANRYQRSCSTRRRAPRAGRPRYRRDRSTPLPSCCPPARCLRAGGTFANTNDQASNELYAPLTKPVWDALVLDARYYGSMVNVEDGRR